MTEQGTPTTTSFATINESGPFSLVESGLPLGITRQPTFGSHVSADLGSISYIELLSQEKLVDVVKISTTTKPDQSVWSFKNTYSDVIALHAPKQNVFRLASWNLHFRFEFRSNFQQVGMALIYQHNYPDDAMSYMIGHNAPTNLSTKLATQLPHLKIAFGENFDAEAVMKWNLPFHALSSDQQVTGNYAWKLQSSQDYPALLNMEPCMGSIHLCVPVQMQVSTGVTPEMTVRIWSWLTDVKLAAYQPDKDNL